jgi:WD40 repeat protein
VTPCNRWSAGALLCLALGGCERGVSPALLRQIELSKPRAPPSPADLLAERRVVAPTLEDTNLPARAILRIRGPFFTNDQGTVLALSPSGRFLALAYLYGVEVLDLDARVRRFRAQRPEAMVGAVAFSPDERRVAVGFIPASNIGGGEASVRLYDVESGREARRLDDKWVHAESLAFSTEGASVHLAGHCLCLWSAATGKLERKLEAPNDLRYASFSADGRVAIGVGVPPISHTSEPDGTRAYFSSPRRLLVWDADATGPRKLLDPGNAERFVLSPDGARVLLTRGQPPGVEVRALDDGRVLAARPEPARAAALSPDGRVGAVSGRDGRIVLVSWPDLHETGTLSGHGSNDVHGLALSRDASRVVSATADEILVWENR